MFILDISIIQRVHIGRYIFKSLYRAMGEVLTTSGNGILPLSSWLKFLSIIKGNSVQRYNFC